jgi:hypothetical protein
MTFLLINIATFPQIKIGVQQWLKPVTEQQQ